MDNWRFWGNSLGIFRQLVYNRQCRTVARRLHHVEIAWEG